jgi:hypothetical protein
LDWPHRWGASLTAGFLVMAALVVGGALYFVDQAGGLHPEKWSSI